MAGNDLRLEEEGEDKQTSGDHGKRKLVLFRHRQFFLAIVFQIVVGGPREIQSKIIRELIVNVVSARLSVSCIIVTWKGMISSTLRMMKRSASTSGKVVTLSLWCRIVHSFSKVCRSNRHALHRPTMRIWGELPRYYGIPLLFGIARDSHTLFVYWEIDWKNVFADKPPMDRKAYLFVTSDDGSEKIRVAVEPFAGNHCVAVSGARSTYRIELGYYEEGENWCSVMISESIATPPDGVSESGEIDVATVPFHLNFQRIVDAFRGSKYDGEALTRIITMLQKSFDESGDVTIPQTEGELHNVIESTLSKRDALERSRLKNSEEAFATRKKIEAILGSGPSSP